MPSSSSTAQTPNPSGSVEPTLQSPQLLEGSASGAGERIAALDGVRGLAVTLVLIYHGLLFGPSPGDGLAGKLLAKVGGLGWIGVDLFFVLSGFFITGILLRSVGTPGWAGRFYARRAWRILPIYYLVLGLTLVVLPLLSAVSVPLLEQPRANALWYGTFFHNWLNLRFDGWPPGDELIGHLWSLAVEEQFYLVWPLVVWLAGPARLVPLAVAVLVLAPAVRFLLVGLGWSDPAIYPLTICRADALAAGALLAVLRARGTALTAGLGWFLLIAGGVCFVGASLVGNKVPEMLGRHLGNSVFTWVLVMWSGLVVLALQPRGPVVALLGWRPLRLVGFFSYTLYLVSYAPSFLIGLWWKDRFASETLANQLAFSTTVAVLSLLVAIASWHLMEKRFLNISGKAPVFR